MKKVNINKCPIKKCKSTWLTTLYSYYDQYHDKQIKVEGYKCQQCNCEFEKTVYVK